VALSLNLIAFFTAGPDEADIVIAVGDVEAA
jgi:hypothetical protein